MLRSSYKTDAAGYWSFPAHKRLPRKNNSIPAQYGLAEVRGLQVERKVAWEKRNNMRGWKEVASSAFSSCVSLGGPGRPLSVGGLTSFRVEGWPVL